MTRRLRSTAASIAALLFVSTTAHGAPIIFTDRASFEAAAVGLVSEGFENSFPNANTVAFTGFSASAQGSSLIESVTDPRSVSEGSRAIAATVQLAGVTFTFTTPILAFGIDVNDFGNIADGSLTAVNNTGSINHTLATRPPSLPIGNTIFFGFIDTTPFQSVTIDLTAFGDRIGLDALSYSSSTAVPEPASLSLLAIGLTGLGARRWRQRRRS